MQKKFKLFVICNVLISVFVFASIRSWNLKETLIASDNGNTNEYTRHTDDGSKINVNKANTPDANVPKENVDEENLPDENLEEENLPDENLDEENPPDENLDEENLPDENVPVNKTNADKNVLENNVPRIQPSRSVSIENTVEDASEACQSQSATRVCSMAERRAHLRSYCKLKGHREGLPTKPPHLLVDMKHQAIYCNIPKVASTTWKGIMALAVMERKSSDNSTYDKKPGTVHSDKFLRRAGLKFISDFGVEERQKMMKNFTSFIIVRHPFDRLVSAWQNKLTDVNSPYRRSLGKSILRKFRNNTNFDTDPKWNTTAKFWEFMEMLATVPSSRRDQHWGLYSKCHPCEADYDLIVKLETRVRDDKILKDLLNYEKEIPSYHPFLGNKPKLCHTGKVLSAFNGVTPGAMAFLLDRYKEDLEMFGYKWNSETREATCSINTEDGDICC